MNELRRVLCRKNNLVLVGILLLLHGIFFIYQCNDMKQNTLTGEALTEYLTRYPAYVTQVLENADSMLENPLFTNRESFVYQNLLKTREDFQNVAGVTPTFGENRGIITVMNFTLTNFVMLLIGVSLVMSFQAERQKGLYLLVRCTCRGRLPLTFQRILALIPGIALPGILLFGITLCISFLLFPGADLSRPVQSIPELSGVTVKCSIGGYLCLYLARKILGCILACLLLYFCMSLLRSSLCIILFIAFFFSEYLLYSFIIPTDRFCVLKYMNLYTMIFGSMDYTHYYNLNLLGHPVSTGSAASLLMLVSFPVFSLLCLWRYTCQYPKADGGSLPFADAMASFFSKKKISYTPFLWECKKILLSQKALFIFIAVFYLAWSASRESSYRNYRSHYITHWYETYCSTVDEELFHAIQTKQQAMTEKLDRLEKSLVRQKEQLIEFQIAGYATFQIESNIERLQVTISEYKKELTGLAVVCDQAQSCLEYSRETGIPVELIDLSCYELLLSKDNKTLRRNYLYVLLAVILMLSGTMACERTSHMEPLLRTLYRGSTALLIRKLVLVFLLSVGCGLSIHMIQFLEIGRVLPYHSLDVNVQSIPFLQWVPFVMTIQSFLILLYLIRAMLAFVMGLAVMVISNYSKSRMTTIALSVFLLVIPMVLLSLFH